LLLSLVTITPSTIATTYVMEDCYQQPTNPPGVLVPTQPPPGDTIDPIKPPIQQESMSALSVDEADNICDDSTTVEQIPEEEVISYKELLEISNAESNQIPLQTEDELKQNVQESYNMVSNDLIDTVNYQFDEQNPYTEDTNLVDYYGELDGIGVNSNNLEQQVHRTNINTEVTPDAAAPVSYVEMAGETIYNSINNTITLKHTIKKIIGKKPSVILTGSDLFSSNTLEGSYAKVIGFDVEWTGTQIYVGKTYSKIFTVSSTKFWITKGTTSTGWTGSYPKTEKSQTYPVLSNKKAVIYPKIYNAHSEQYLPMPNKANLAIVPIEKRVDRNALPYRSNYIIYYKKIFGDPKWNWADYDVHHVVPLEYGGNHNMSNLFALKRSIHQNVVHGGGWWKNY